MLSTGSSNHDGQNTVSILEPNVDSRTFFNDHVKSRIAAKFNGVINDEGWKGNLWSNDYLRSKSGECTVKVEQRDDTNDKFGRGSEISMRFDAFLESIAAGDERLYLTTQELTYNHEGQPSITSPPVDGLIGDFPWLPKLTGNLIPQNINIWFGSAINPSTTGLHHDFHDNIYILLRGEKRFLLISPHEASNCYTFGEISKIHPNGRINYKGQQTRADGSDIKSIIALQASQKLDEAAAGLFKVTLRHVCLKLT
jgi:hypothetical protein